MVFKTAGYNDFISLLRSCGFDWLANEVESNFDQFAGKNKGTLSKEEGQIRFCAALSYLYLIDPFNYVHRAAVELHAMRLAKGQQVPVPLTFNDEVNENIFSVSNLKNQDAHYKQLSEILKKIIKEPYPPPPNPGGITPPPPSGPPQPSGEDGESFVSGLNFGRR